MHPRPDSDFDWISSTRLEPAPKKDQNWPGCSLSVLLPPNFEAYAKILHQITANYEHVDHPHPFTEREIAILKIPPCTEMRSLRPSARREKVPE
jgi:hypothetical protein